MKFIENSVEAIKSQEEEEMASCEVVQVNGEVKKVDTSKDSAQEDSKILNGIHDKVDQTNGEKNEVFTDEMNCDDEEFHLELEPSEDGSPMKNGISAEALTKEITALLGESSEGIDEELKKIDGLKSEELIDEEEEVALLNGEGLSQTSCEEKVSTDLKNDGNTSEIEKEKHEDSDEPQKENTAPVSSSRYDVELEEDIWIDGNCDTQTSEVCKLEDKTENSEIEKVKTILSAKTKEMTDIPLSQTSDMSENDAWTVIDSVETSEDEEKQSQEKKIELEPENDSEEMIVSSTVTDNEVSETTQTKDQGRKRSASVEEQVVEQKKVKLDQDEQLEDKVSLPLKRYSSDLLEGETKKPRSNGLLLEEEYSDLLSNEDSAIKNKEVISELEEEKSNIPANKLEDEGTNNSTPDSLQESVTSSVVNKPSIIVNSDVPLDEMSVDEKNTEAAVEEPTESDECLNDVIEEPLVEQESSAAEVKETSNNSADLETVDEKLVLVEEIATEDKPTEDKPSEVENDIDIETEILSKDEPNSETLVEKLQTSDISQEKTLEEGGVIPEGVAKEMTDIMEAVEETPDILEAVEETPVTLKETKSVDEKSEETECVIKSETKTEKSSVKPPLSSNTLPLSSSSDSSELEAKIKQIESIEKPAEAENKTSKEDRADAKNKMETKGSSTEIEKKISKVDKSHFVDNKDSKNKIKDILVNDKITYKLTPIDTEPVVKKPSASTLRGNVLSESKNTNVLRLKPEKELKMPVEEKKTYATLQPMEVTSNDVENKQTSVSKRKLSSEAPVEAKTESVPKAVTNLDKAIESVVKKSRCSMFMVLKKFHKNQLKKMTRSELEEAVVLKICEAVTDKSELGQMRQKYQTLEQDLESWKKKATQYEKQIRELDMVVKRFLSEAESLAGQKDSKPLLPIKVTRSVGLQVVLASSMHGQVVNKNKQYQQEKQMQLVQQQQQQQQQQQMQMASTKKIAERLARDQARSSGTYTPPMQQNASSQPRKPGRPPKISESPVPSISQPITPAPNKPIISRLKPAVGNKASPTVKSTSTTPSKDLEVIDLTDKEEKTKVVPSPSSVGGIRVAPQTQVCFVQQSVATTPTQMAYIVQKPGQRQQYLVATSSASPQKPTQTTRLSPTGMPTIYRTNNQLISVPSSQSGARTQSTASSPHKPAVQSRPQPTAPTPNNVVKKHPAPLPSAPVLMKKPGLKLPPSKPLLKIAKTVTGIMLSWSMTLTDNMADMASYQLFAYQEGNQPPTTALWKKVGDVKALPLPMACTLTQFIEGHKYHFAVRAVDAHGRIGPFSHPGSILLKH